MLTATVRILTIFVTSILVICFALFGLRSCGQNRSFLQSNWPGLEKLPKYFAMGGVAEDKVIPYSEAAYHRATELGYGLGVPLRTDENGSWYVFAGYGMSTQKSGLVDKPVAFENLIKAHPHQYYYLIVDQPKFESALVALRKTLETYKATEQVLISSGYADTTKWLRESATRWLVGASVSELASLKLWSSLYLETVIDTPFEFVSLKDWNQRLGEEMRRRNRVLFYQVPAIEDVSELQKKVASSILIMPN